MTSDQNQVLTKALKAIALSYDDPAHLPKVLASGQDALARIILEIAAQTQIPVERNEQLVELLDKQKPGPVISQPALKVLSEVIAFLYHTDSQWKAKHGDLRPVLER